MKKVLVGMLLASVIILPAQADNNSRRHGGSGGSGGGSGTAAAPSASSSSTATGGAGGAGGNGTGGNATGGSATGGNATGGAATGGRSNASGNTSTVTVSLNNNGSGSGSAGSAAADPSGAQTVRYEGSYTVKAAPPVAAPSLTSTFSDTCMGSTSFGLSFVGFGATGGTTMVDEACVRRLDSREFRAMGLNDVALALLCQSAANRKAVESTGRACPSAAPAGDTAAAKPAQTVALAPRQDPAPAQTQPAMSLAPETPLPEPAPQAEQAPQAPQPPQAADVPQQAMVNEATATPGPVPAQDSANAVEIAPAADAVAQ
jgi:hypothetical protein